MLQSTKSITLSGYSIIDGVQVIYMVASIRSDGRCDGPNKTILNPTIYNSNKVECRKDVSDFETKVCELEDSIVLEEVVV